MSPNERERLFEEAQSMLLLIVRLANRADMGAYVYSLVHKSDPTIYAACFASGGRAITEAWLVSVAEREDTPEVSVLPPDCIALMVCVGGERKLMGLPWTVAEATAPGGAA